MNIITEELPAVRLKFSVRENGEEIGRASLVMSDNDLHSEPFGLLEDVFVLEKYRGKGIGDELVKRVIREAKKRGCYKLIATSRFSREAVHQWYERLGFVRHGIEFRMNLI